MKDMVKLVQDVESNVIPTGAGFLTNSASDEISDFMHTAMRAAASTIHDPMMMLDVDLIEVDEDPNTFVKIPSPRFERLERAGEKAANKARFAKKEAPVKAETATTIRVGNTVIRPLGA